MREPEGVVAAVLTAAGGELVSRIRLQKTVYLLDRLGFGSGLDDFAYYRYGPYSAALDAAVDYAKVAGLVAEERRHRMSDGATYSVFKRVGDVDTEAEESSLGEAEVERLVRRFAATNLTVLELAATADWVRRSEKREDWRAEVVRRKGPKTENGRLDKAVDLLDELGLSPSRPAVPAT